MGSSLLLNIVIVIIGVVSAFLISSIAYSKAFKVKNRIVSVIEKYNGDCNFDNDADTCYSEINSELQDMGYSSNISHGCSDEDTLVYGKNNVRYHFCVNKYTLCDEYKTDGKTCKDDSNETYYYKVTTFMHFDIPLIGQVLEFPVSGETKNFYETFINIKE